MSETKGVIVDLLKWFVENNKRLSSFLVAMAGILLLISWPAVATVLYLERTGVIGDRYHVDHQEIQVRQDEDTAAIKSIDLRLTALGADVLINRGIMRDWAEESAWLAKRTCINTAKTDPLRDECYKPKWQRKLDEK